MKKNKKSKTIRRQTPTRKASAKKSSKSDDFSFPLSSTAVKAPPRGKGARELRRRGLAIVALGASAGGLGALTTFFSKIPSAQEWAYVVVQHADLGGDHLTPEILQGLAPWPVVEIQSGLRLEAGRIYLVPHRGLVDVVDQRFQLQMVKKREQDLTIIDHFFKSLALDFKTHAVGIILSGEGSDGALGLKAISDAGGMTICQDPANAAYPAMPANALSTGVVDHILKVNEMSHELESYARYLSQMADGGAIHSLREQIGMSLNVICEILFKSTHHDFKHYKTTTLIRRIQRRMQVLQLSHIDSYIQQLREHPTEADSLFKELLINVTSFFRDPEAFESLREEVIAKALRQPRPPGQKFRVWVAGCSSGEEVYTMAMLINEELAKMSERPEIQIIATDIDESALAQARKGSYPFSVSEQVSPERLNRFFQKRGGRYHITKELREMCLFSAHNLINDPPFSQLDLISCRNVLIYLGLHLQKKLIPVFHYALKPGGHLFLGTSESLSTHKELFKSVSAKHRIAQRKATAIRPAASFSSVMTQNFSSHQQESQRTQEVDLQLVGQRIILDEFAPRYVIVNDEFQVVSVSSGISPYLQPSQGTFQNHLVKLVSPSLRPSLRSALNEAKKHRRKIDTESATLKFEDGLRRVGLTVQPMPQLGDESGLFMVIFHRLGKMDHEMRGGVEAAGAGASAGVDNAELVDQLEKELGLLREDLEKTVQDLEASNEELKSSNEELLSMNEELQSANEELETSKEEVQSVNEALQHGNNDLENILASTAIATVFLDNELQIQNYTPALETIYNITRQDIGRPITHFTHTAKSMPPYPDPKKVNTEEALIESDLEMQDGRWILRRISPYKTTQRTLSGIVVTFIDVTHLRLAEESYGQLADSMPQIIWTASPEGKVYYFNRRWYEYTGMDPNDPVSKQRELVIHPDDRQMAMQVWAAAVRTGKPYEAEYRIQSKRTGSYRWFLGRAVPALNSKGQVTKWYGSSIDIHDRVQAEESRRESEWRFQTMANTAPVLVWMANTEKIHTWFNKGWLNFTGRTAQEEYGIGWQASVHPDDLERGVKIYASSFDQRKEFYLEYRLRHHGGEYRWVSETGVPRFTPDGTFEGYIGACMDIHGQRVAAEQMKENDQRLNLMFETSPSFMCVLRGEDFVFEKVNSQYLKLVGQRDVIGKSVAEALPEIKDQGFIELLRNVLSSEKPFIGKEMPILIRNRPDAPPEERFLDFVYQPDRSLGWKQPLIFVHGNDVTEKVKARRLIESSKAAIENERENFRNLFKQTPEMVCILSGPHHLFEFVNEAHVKVLGFNATGKTVREAQPELIEVHGILDDVYRTGITAELSEIAVTLGGRIRFFNLTYAARRDERGQVSGVMILGTEVTDLILRRETLRSQNNALELTLRGARTEEVLNELLMMVEEKMGGGAMSSILLMDKSGKRLLHGAAPTLPAEYSEATHDQPIGPHMGSCGSAAFSSRTIISSDIEHDPLWKNFKDLARQYELKSCWSAPIFSSGGRVLGTFALYYKEVKKPLAEEIHLLEYLSRTASLVIERKAVQDEIQIARDEAEEARATAEAASESKTRFLANMSHEIRTPLAAILGFSDLLQEKISSDPEKSREYLDRISRNASQLGRLIDELLDLSKIEADRLEIEHLDFDLRSAVEDSISTVIHRAREKGLVFTSHLTPELPALINSDPTRFRQILTNVIGNAIKFTEEGKVDLYIEAQKGKLSIRVKDTGIGIAPEQQQRLFQPFMQADNSVTRKYGGTGLGLALSKQLALLMGGDLLLKQSVVGEGSEFLLTLALGETADPKKVEGLPENKNPDSSAELLKGKTILVVDDSEDNLTIIKLFINVVGGAVETAENGLEGVEKMRRKTYDLVLMDIQMPILDGYEALKVAISSGYRGPIIALTAHAMKDEKDRCLAAGFKDYLSKPVNRPALIQKIYEVTQKK